VIGPVVHQRVFDGDSLALRLLDQQARALRVSGGTVAASV
jgi:hypothetical protein